MTPESLIVASLNKKAVTGFHPLSPDGRLPATFIIGMPFRTVMAALPRLKIYKPKKHGKQTPKN